MGAMNDSARLADALEHYTTAFGKGEGISLVAPTWDKLHDLLVQAAAALRSAERGESSVERRQGERRNGNDTAYAVATGKRDPKGKSDRRAGDHADGDAAAKELRDLSDHYRQQADELSFLMRMGGNVSTPSDTSRTFPVCSDHLNADWNQPALEDDACVLCRLFYLEAQESLLEEWQQRAKRAEETIADIQRPLDAQMARLNAQVTQLNGEKFQQERENNALRTELESARADAESLRQAMRDSIGSILSAYACGIILQRAEQLTDAARSAKERG